METDLCECLASIALTAVVATPAFFSLQDVINRQQYVTQFLQRIPQLTLGKAAYNCSVCAHRCLSRPPILRHLFAGRMGSKSSRVVLYLWLGVWVFCLFHDC